MDFLPYHEWSRREEAFLSIDHDGAITTRQLMRHHGLRSGDLGGRVKRVVRDVGVTASTRRPSRVTFLTTSLTRLGGTQLREYALLAEIRAVLKVGVGSWESPHVDPDRLLFRGGTSEPDALWQPRHGPWVAIEADAGAYSRKRVQAKAAAFAEVFHKQIWGCPSERRKESLEKWLREVGADFDVVVANPFTPVREGETQISEDSRIDPAPVRERWDDYPPI